MNKPKQCVHLRETLKGCICALTDCEVCTENPWGETCNRPEAHYYEQMAKEEVEE